MAFYTVTLTKVQNIADGTKMFCFTKPEGFDYLPGQYVAMRITDLVEPDTKNGVRSLSLASAPSEEFLGFGVRVSDSGFKKTLWTMKPGATVEVTKAVGFFTIPETEEREIIFLIGGIGITPVRSMLKQAEFEKSQKRYTLFFANRLPKDAPFAQEIKEYILPNLQMIEVMSQCGGDRANDSCDEHGYIRHELVQKYVAEPQLAIYYLVGSMQFIEVMEKMLTELGLTKESWHTDPFTGLESKGKK
jgi:ferredoxin-NADP reductase